MAKQRSSSGKILAFDAARVRPAAKPKAVANGTPRSGYLEAWLKNHDDSQSLIRENLSLKDQKRLLEEARTAHKPNVAEHVLFYSTLALATLILIATFTTLFLTRSSL